MGNLLSAAAPVRQQSATPVVYVEEDFTATTTGDLSDNNLAVDELGGGWQGHTSHLTYNASGEGVEATTNKVNRRTLIETSGREDVQVTMTATIKRGGSNTNWQGVGMRAPTSTTDITDILCAWFRGTAIDPNLALHDGRTADPLLKTWDLSVLLATQPQDGDTITLVMRCSGDDITLYSMQVNGGSVETVDDTYTLTGAVATAHGAGSGADCYGLLTDERVASSSVRFEYFKVESIPA